MFDIGFTEMMLIAVVALIVIGPERLPKVARTIGHLFGRAQRYVSDVKTEINREIEIDELRRLQAEMQTAARKLEGDVQKSMNEAESSFRKETTQVEADLNASLDEAEAEAKKLKEQAATTPSDGQTSSGKAHLASGGTQSPASLASQTSPTGEASGSKA